MFLIFGNFIFLISKFIVFNKTCFSSSENGDAIANALIVSSKLCFSRAFQLIIKPFLSNNALRSLNMSSKSQFKSFVLSKS